MWVNWDNLANCHSGFLVVYVSIKVSTLIKPLDFVMVMRVYIHNDFFQTRCNCLCFTHHQSIRDRWLSRFENTSGKQLRRGEQWTIDAENTSSDWSRWCQIGWICDWQSTRQLEAVPTTIHIGSDDQDDRDTHWVRQVEIDTDTGLRWCCMGHCCRPLQLEGATTTPAGQAWLMMMIMMNQLNTERVANDTSLPGRGQEKKMQYFDRAVRVK